MLWNAFLLNTDCLLTFGILTISFTYEIFSLTPRQAAIAFSMLQSKTLFAADMGNDVWRTLYHFAYGSIFNIHWLHV